MSDVLFPDVPDDAGGTGSVTTDDLQRFDDTFADLADPDVMTEAWD